MSPLVALFGHGAMSDLSPLSDQKRTYLPGQLLPAQPDDVRSPGVKWTSRLSIPTSEVDPNRPLIGSIRRECIDHIVIFGERHLRHVLLSYMGYYNGTRTHLSLNKDAPISRTAETVGHIICHRILGGLHHQYSRI